MMSPLDSSRFVKANTCLPCCASPPVCNCGLLMPIPSTAPYVDYATALAALAAYTANCIVYGIGTGGAALDSLSGNDTTANTLRLIGSKTQANASVTMKSSVSIRGGFTLTVAWLATITGGSSPVITYSLEKCDGTVVDTQTSTSLSGSFTYALATDGEYLLTVSVNATGATAATGDFTLSSTDALFTNSVIALWNDAGTTRQLEACRRNIDPVCGVFISKAAAVAELASPNVVNCLGIIGPDSGMTINSASVVTGPPAVFNFSLSKNGASPNGMLTLSVELDAGETVTCTYSLNTNGLSGGGTATYAYFLDAACVQLAVAGPVLWPATPVPIAGTNGVFTAPYKGRFLVQFLVFSADFPAADPWTVNGSFTITPSAAMPVNTVAAKFTAQYGFFPPTTLPCGQTIDC